MRRFGSKYFHFTRLRRSVVMPDVEHDFASQFFDRCENVTGDLSQDEYVGVKCK
jgi:hypothetical protein